MKAVTKPRKPLPQHQIQIGLNLRRWREGKGLKRTAIASALRETHEKLANYEAGRAPLPWLIFLKLWATYDVNPRFLATGLGSEEHPFPILRTLLPTAPARARFSEVYAGQLEHTFEQLARNELPGHIKDLENFVRLAKAGGVEAIAVRLVALSAHKNHSFPKTVIIGSGKPSTTSTKASDAR